MQKKFDKLVVVGYKICVGNKTIISGYCSDINNENKKQMNTVNSSMLT